MMIELGSNQFEVEEINYINNLNAEVFFYIFFIYIIKIQNIFQVQLSIIEGPNASEKPKIKLGQLKNSINIGRKPTADLNFPDDHHLSNIHAKLCLIDGKVFLEEMGSTNG